MLNVKVTNMCSPRSGNPVPNQYVIRTPDSVFFQSYDSVIARVDYNTGKTTLDVNTWDYSNTTTRYRNEFLGENTAATRAKIESGEYELADLN